MSASKRLNDDEYVAVIETTMKEHAAYGDEEWVEHFFVYKKLNIRSNSSSMVIFQEWKMFRRNQFYIKQTLSKSLVHFSEGWNDFFFSFIFMKASQRQSACIWTEYNKIWRQLFK